MYIPFGLTIPPLRTLKKVVRAGGVAQAMKHLPSKWKALTLNPSTTKKKKKKRKKIKGGIPRILEEWCVLLAFLFFFW
jgi:hypothetical protein